ncbi:unnamed protein product [Parajaminaea phylloscopi]
MDWAGQRDNNGGGGGGVYGMFGQAAQHLAAEQQRQSGSSAGGGTGDGSSGASAQFDWDIDSHTDTKALDLVFIMDATGSMGSYIASATNHIETICDNIIQSEQLSAPGSLRVGLVAFRDHPPQDYSYITKCFPLTSDVAVIKSHLKELYASGGGDGPEAVTAALKATLEMEWRPAATRLAVLIADAPPHGIGEYGDGFADGSPEGSDPLVIARTMAQMGIALFMVACEPALASYSFAADFYQALVRITSGLLVPLTTASLLTHAIIAAAGEAMALDRLHREIGDEVADRLRTLSLEGVAGRAQTSQGLSDLMDDVARDIHRSLLLRNESTKQLVVESIYRDSPESRHNIEAWSTAPDIKSAKPFIQKVHGSRLSDKFLASRHTSLSSYSPYPRATSGTGGSDTSWNNLYGSSKPSSPSFTSGSTPRLSSSSGSGDGFASRKVVSDFSSFSAAGRLSVSGSQGPRTGTAFYGGARDIGGNDDDDDGDEDDEQIGRKQGGKPLPVAVETDEGGLEVAGDDGSTLRFRMGAISLDQARRLAMQSAYRGGLA